MEIEIDDIDHLVLLVADVERTIAFYERALGMEAVTYRFRGRRHRALGFGERKINLHPADTTERPLGRWERPGSADFCLLTSTPVEAVAEHLAALGVEIEHGPDAADGAAGPLRSIWFRDPDDNLIEVANRDREGGAT